MEKGKITIARKCQEKERKNQRFAEEAKLKAEQEMKAKIMAELRKMTQLQENHSLKIKEEEGKKKYERELALQKENEEIRISQLRGIVFRYQSNKPFFKRLFQMKMSENKKNS